MEFVSVGLDAFWLLLLLKLKLLEVLFLPCLNLRLNKGGRFGLECGCDGDLVLLMVKGIGGFRGLPFNTVLAVDPAPTLLLLLVLTFRGRVAFVVESGIGVLLVLFSTSSEGDDSMTLSNLVDRKPEEEETLNPSVR